MLGYDLRLPKHQLSEETNLKRLRLGTLESRYESETKATDFSSKEMFSLVYKVRTVRRSSSAQLRKLRDFWELRLQRSSFVNSEVRSQIFEFPTCKLKKQTTCGRASRSNLSFWIEPQTSQFLASLRANVREADHKLPSFCQVCVQTPKL